MMRRFIPEQEENTNPGKASAIVSKPKKNRLKPFRTVTKDFKDNEVIVPVPTEDVPVLEMCKKCPNVEVRAKVEAFNIMYNTIRVLQHELGLGETNGDWEKAVKKMRSWMHTRAFENFKLSEMKRQQKR